jgi:hypothetical protein
MRILQVLSLAAVGGLTASVVKQSVRIQTNNISLETEAFLLPVSLSDNPTTEISVLTPPLLNKNDTAQERPRPPLDTLIHPVHGNLTGANVSWLLDFAIVGFGKCGTSTVRNGLFCFSLQLNNYGLFHVPSPSISPRSILSCVKNIQMMEWLANHPEVACFRKEQCTSTRTIQLNGSNPSFSHSPFFSSLPDYADHLSGKKEANMVQKLYQKLPEGPYKRGYKAPTDVTQMHVLQSLEDHFPKARLLIGIRHPILWFQSLYNFRTQNFMDLETQLPHPDKLIGKCVKGSQNTCTIKGDFAYHLYKLGKTVANVTTQPTALERQIHARWHPHTAISKPIARPNPVFLFEMSQLASKEEAKRKRLRGSVRNFLGLEEEMPPMPHKIPSKKFDNATQRIKNERKIRICDDEYLAVRQHLMELSKQTYHWFYESFLQSPGVAVSDRQDFLEAMEFWLHDPCDAIE